MFEDADAISFDYKNSTESFNGCCLSGIAES